MQHTRRLLRTKLLASAALILGSIFGSGAARAEAWTIDYTTTLGDIAHLNIITDNSLTNGATNVIGISGERDGLAITGLSPYAASDQLLFQIDPYVDFSGLSFFTSDGNAYNLFTNPGYFELASTVDAVGYPQFGVAISSIRVSDVSTVAVVPEPMSLGLLGAGVFGLGVMKRRKA